MWVVKDDSLEFQKKTKTSSIEWVIPHMYMCHVAHVNESMSHVRQVRYFRVLCKWVSSVSHMFVSCCTAHLCMWQDTCPCMMSLCTWGSEHAHVQVSCRNASFDHTQYTERVCVCVCLTHLYVMSHVSMSHVTQTQYSSALRVWDSRTIHDYIFIHRVVFHASDVVVPDSLSHNIRVRCACEIVSHIHYLCLTRHD